VIRGCRKLSTKPWLFSSPRRRERECAETVSALAGASFHERMAASPLTEAGLPELIATDAAGYVALAAGLAQNPKRPAELRATRRASRQRWRRATGRSGGPCCGGLADRGRMHRAHSARRRTPYSVLRTPYFPLRTSHSVLPTPHSVLRTPYFPLRTPYSVLRTSHSVLRTCHSVLPTPYSALLHANTTQVVAMYLTPTSSRFARCSCVQKGGNSTSLPRSGRTLKCW